MASNARIYKYYQVPIGYFIDKIRKIAYAGLSITFTGEAPMNGGTIFYLKHGVSFSSWGEEIKVCVTVQGNQTCVDIYSECAMPTQIVDWGKNNENVARIFAYLEQGMPYQQQYQQPQQQYQQPQQQYQQPQQQYQQPQQQYQQPQQQYQQPQAPNNYPANNNNQNR